MKRTVFWKRMTALALAAILLLGLLPAAAFGAEPSDEPVQTKYVYEETDGVCRAVREEDALPKSPPPSPRAPPPNPAESLPLRRTCAGKRRIRSIWRSTTGSVILKRFILAASAGTTRKIL